MSIFKKKLISELLLLPLWVLILLPLSAFGQIPNAAEPQRPYESFRKVGEMFTITLHPNDKEIKFRVVGNEYAKIKISENDITAKIKVGDREWSLAPRKSQGQFVAKPPLDMPTNLKSELKIEVRRNTHKEDFHFELAPRQKN